MMQTQTNIPTQNGQPLLSVRDLKTYFHTEEGVVKAVNGVSFELKQGETLGIVGESGSGKSVTNLSIVRLLPQAARQIAGGQVLFEGKDLLTLSERELREIRGGEIAMVFQDPMTSLNPFLRISTQMTEVIRLHLNFGKREALARAIEMLELVGIPDAKSRIHDYPHQFSGGMRQRVMIAMALACRPKLLIADEPTTALDVTIQAQILELIKKLKEETGTSVILITHDLGVVAGMTDHVIVMYAGRVFESASTEELFQNPQNPYTRALLHSVPDPTRADEPLAQIPGLPPDLTHLPANRCPFVDRCPEAISKCREAMPPYHQVGPNHYSLCWVR